ncbi:MAG: hypothetical protein IPG18_15380 [Saprospiraceae bacterium]|nr:hypothetical protein [Saprospiraceae bacterium]
MGNYRDLLYDITLHTAMGFYILSHLNNPMEITEENIHPGTRIMPEKSCSCLPSVYLN